MESLFKFTQLYNGSISANKTYALSESIKNFKLVYVVFGVGATSLGIPSIFQISDAEKQFGISAWNVSLCTSTESIYWSFDGENTIKTGSLNSISYMIVYGIK